MKKMMRAFTLAELLLCIGIIGIVSAMGMVITKHSTERAYNLYYYTGYINLYNSIAEAKTEGKESIQDIMNYVKELMNDGGADANRIVAINGIEYVYSVGAIQNERMNIQMSVPVAKTRNNNGLTSVELCFDNSTPGYLIPIAPSGGSSAPNLQIRRDLLPAYIDDGKVGRNNIVNRDGFNYAKPIYGSYKDAYCSIRGSSGNITGVITCNNYVDIRRVENGARLNGFLKIASPQKVH